MPSILPARARGTTETRISLTSRAITPVCAPHWSTGPQRGRERTTQPHPGSLINRKQPQRKNHPAGRRSCPEDRCAVVAGLLDDGAAAPPAALATGSSVEFQAHPCDGSRRAVADGDSQCQSSDHQCSGNHEGPQRASGEPGGGSGLGYRAGRARPRWCPLRAPARTSRRGWCRRPGDPQRRQPEWRPPAGPSSPPRRPALAR